MPPSPSLQEQSHAPYQTSLDYLGDHFQRLISQIKFSEGRLAKDLGGIDDMNAVWERNSRGKRINLHEYTTKLTLIEGKIAARCVHRRATGSAAIASHANALWVGCDWARARVCVCLVLGSSSPTGWPSTGGL
jgi:hypothetical protein